MTFRVVASFFKAPVSDYLDALQCCLEQGRRLHLLLAVAAFLVAWWIYVPLHELFHAFGCLVAGGSVSRLEIAPEYGAALLQTWFPFVAVGSDYAGQLVGFDVNGSDLVYLITVAFPYLLTVFIGVPLLRAAALAPLTVSGRCLALGASVPAAYAPFVSITGDYYELGSILLTRLTAVATPDASMDRWRSDDLFLLAEELFFSGQAYSGTDILIVGGSLLLGVALAFATYQAGRLASRLALISPATCKKGG